ncbi:hypothetical protein ACLOJK_016201 [Asimina triloba]
MQRRSSSQRTTLPESKNRGANEMQRSCRSPSQIKQVHAHILKTGHVQSQTTHLLLTCASCCPPPELSYSLSLFHCLQPTTNTFVWNTMIRVFIQSNYPDQALSLYARMRRYGISCDSFSLTFALKACSHLRRLPHAEQLHTHVVKASFLAQPHVQSALMHAYAGCGGPSPARKLFDEIPERSTTAWCVLIAAYAETGDLESCRMVFNEMPERDLASWNTMVDAYVRCGQPGEALNLFREMEATGLSPNHVTMLGVISACGEMGELEFGRWIHFNYIENYALKCNNLRVSTALTDMYLKCGRADLAMEVFNRMDDKDLLSWTAIICGMAINGQGDRALRLFDEMEKAGVWPDEVTFLGVLSACSHAGFVKEGRRYFSSMVKDYGLEPRIEHYGSMVDMMGRAGLIGEAQQFIENMPMQPNLVVWRSLLASCRVHGAVEVAEWVRERLEAVGQVSNDDTSVVLSNLYAEERRWGEAESIRRLMKEMGRNKKWGCSLLHV